MLKQIMLRQFFKPFSSECVCVYLCLNNSSKNRNFKSKFSENTSDQGDDFIPHYALSRGGSPLNLLSLQDNTDSRISGSGVRKGGPWVVVAVVTLSPVSVNSLFPIKIFPIIAPLVLLLKK